MATHRKEEMTDEEIKELISERYDQIRTMQQAIEDLDMFRPSKNTAQRRENLFEENLKRKPAKRSK